jgi:hypothetical protein
LESKHCAKRATERKVKPNADIASTSLRKEKKRWYAYRPFGIKRLQEETMYQVEPSLCDDREIGKYTKPIPKQQLDKHVPTAKNQ